MADFQTWFSHLLTVEGGYSNDPADPGGETMHGITRRVALSYGYTGSMKALPTETAGSIAKAHYWDVLKCDLYAQAVAEQLADAMYNGGRPVRWAQLACGLVVDGVLGPRTIEALKAVDPARFALTFTAQRLSYLASLSTFPRFGRGWSQRLAGYLLRASK